MVGVVLSGCLVAAGCLAGPAGPPGAPAQQPGHQTTASPPPVRMPAALGPAPVMRVLTSGLANPWELLWGPDNYLWVTEKTGKKVDRINPADGARATVLELPQVTASGAQDGLLGMAFGPGAVFLMYNYGPLDQLRGKIVRYRYDQAAAILADPVDILDNLPASVDHNAGRLLLGPDQKLYYALGDLGNNQFDRACQPIRAQQLPTQAQVDAKDWSNYPGKTLRLNLDGTIPPDNPVIHGVRSHIFTYGHRNPQGLAVGPGGRIYSDEHGPKSDDEVNVLAAGKNYGWPFVSGFRDGQAYQYANWSGAPNCPDLAYDDYQVPASVPREASELTWNDPDYVEPIKTFYTVPTGHNFQDPACGAEPDLCWPSIAPGSIEYLPADQQGTPAPSPLLSNTLLLPSLKVGSLFLVKLTGDGGFAQGNIEQLFSSRNRYRDVAVGRHDYRYKIYIATDSEGSSGPQSLSRTGKLDNPGSILEFTVTPPDQGPGH